MALAGHTLDERLLTATYQRQVAVGEDDDDHNAGDDGGDEGVGSYSWIPGHRPIRTWLGPSTPD